MRRRSSDIFESGNPADECARGYMGGVVIAPFLESQIPHPLAYCARRVGHPVLFFLREPKRLI